nr:MAG TPA: hypothetical protein [Caudoviricetes sp.]
MAACVLGDICRARLNKIDSTILLSQYCRVCANFNPKNNINKQHTIVVINELKKEE